MQLRKAELVDLEEIQKLFVETVKFTCKNDYSSEQIIDWVSSAKDIVRWKDFIRNEYFLIAEISGCIVGFCSVDFEKGNYLNLMYIHKDHLRLGIAGRLLGAIQEEYRRRGVKSIVSDVSITARAFFEKNGFVVLKDHDKKNSEIINFRMEKEL